MLNIQQSKGDRLWSAYLVSFVKNGLWREVPAAKCSLSQKWLIEHQISVVVVVVEITQINWALENRLQRFGSQN